MLTELKPCPFCGGTLAVDGSAPGHAENCYIVLRLANRGTDDEFHAAWNRRAASAAPAEGREASLARAITDWPGYWIGGQKVTPEDYIGWLLKRLAATEAARLPEQKYYGSQEVDGDQHAVKCAYVDGWNECRAAMPATAPTMSEADAKDAARYRFLRSQMQVGAVRTLLPLYRVLHWHGFEDCNDVRNADEAIDAEIERAAAKGESE